MHPFGNLARRLIPRHASLGRRERAIGGSPWRSLIAARSLAVPPELIRYTNGHEDLDEYLRSGFEVATMLRMALDKYFHRQPREFQRVLDFGCGSGRIAQFLAADTTLIGCDVNEQLVAYCARAIPEASFHPSPLMPPLTFSDASFDLVFSFSVFSHLRKDVERQWLAELSRVGSRDCIYLISVQGDWMIEATLEAEMAAAKAAGFYFRKVHARHGGDLDFPDYYEASYHTAAWIRQHWSEYFQIIDVIKGDDVTRYLAPGQAFEPGGAIPRLRPMGQDLVVARNL